MPRPGGEADKLGNRYEGLWAVDAALDLIDGEYASLEFEAVGDEAAGIDFRRTTNAGVREHHSIKRSHHAGHWTLSRLTDRGNTGRSILGDLAAKTCEGNYGVFSSGTSASVLEELIRRARASDTLEAFRRRIESSALHSGQFGKYVVPIYCNEHSAYRGLRLLDVRTTNEPMLEKVVERRIRSMFRMRTGEPTYAKAVRLLIADLMIQSMGNPLTAEALLQALDGHGVQRSQLKGDDAIGQLTRALTRSCVAEVEALLVNQSEIVRKESATVLAALLDDCNHVMLEGLAGSGKSCVLAQVLKQLDSQSVPTLAIRLDRLTPDDLSTQVIGTRRGLPDSPAISLGEFAGDQPSVLCLDQIDALSLISGRRQAFWGPFSDLLREVRAYPKMRILFACRSFDLDHDSRLRELVEDEDGAARISIGLLDDRTVLAAIKSSGISPRTLSQKQIELLSVPLHLYLYIESARSGPLDFTTAGDLFDAFWDYKARAVEGRAGQQGVFPIAVGALCDALSQRESLVAPRLVLDDLPEALPALASEAVVHVDSGNIRFFHESFFDYAFARTFLRQNSDLVQWLASDEQHLFRRSQVRQVLIFLRSRETDQSRYLHTLRSLLEDTCVRFHIKKVVLDWLGTLPDPTSNEWWVLEDLADQLHTHMWGVVSNSVPWFDVLQEMGRWRSWLSSDDQDIDRAISQFRMPDVLNARSAVVAELVNPFRGKSDAWRDRLRWLMEIGYGYTSPEMQTLFISLVADGTLDYARPRFATNDNWWSVLYRPSTNTPEFTAKVLGAWFDRQIDRAAELGHMDPFDDQLALVTYSQFSSHVIKQCSARVPREFVREMFPRLANFENTVPKRWIEAPGMHGKPDDELREALAEAMIHFARNDPAELDSIVGMGSPSDGRWMSALLLRAWSANPDYYGEHIVRFLVDRRDERLSLGYDLSISETDSFVAISRTAVAAASRVCSDDSFAELESLILYFTTDWEREHRWIGRAELALLRALDQDRISDPTLRRIRELERRFPEARERGSPEPPHQEAIVQAVISPIPPEALPHMSDTHWLSAMAKYSGVRSAMREGRFVGGALELSRDLERLVREDPGRFSSLATLMDEALPSIYFEAVLRGLTTKEKGPGRSGTVDQVCLVLRTIVELEVQVPGREIARAVGSLAEAVVPDDILQLLCRVALHDPDPEGDNWQDADVGKEPITQAINSARGEAAMALAKLLFADSSRWSVLRPIVERLVVDRVLAVRSVAVRCLLAIIDVDRGAALAGFERLTRGADLILGTPYVESFVRYMAIREYGTVRPTLFRMLRSSQSAVVRSGARQVALAALWVDEARDDGSSLLEMDEDARVGAAGVYANYLSNEAVGPECDARLRELFADESEAVREAASGCWRALEPDQIATRGSLIGAFAKSLRPGADIAMLVHGLRESQRPLPVELCDLADRAVLAFGSRAASFQFKEAGAAHDLSPLMVRLHEETSDPALRERVLDLIDKMVRAGFYGLNEQLRKQYERDTDATDWDE